MQDIEKALEKEMDNMQTTTQAGPDLQSMFSTQNSKPGSKLNLRKNSIILWLAAT